MSPGFFLPIAEEFAKEPLTRVCCNAALRFLLDYQIVEHEAGHVPATFFSRAAFGQNVRYGQTGCRTEGSHYRLPGYRLFPRWGLP
jgi:hypothetical protein